MEWRCRGKIWETRVTAAKVKVDVGLGLVSQEIFCC